MIYEKDARGVDYDLSACLEYNNVGFEAGDIHRVLAVVEGEKDRTPWFWLLELCAAPKYVVLIGSCDYTGWDCQSGAKAGERRTSAPAALASAPEQDDQDDYATAHAKLAEQYRAGRRTATKRDAVAATMKEGV